MSKRVFCSVTLLILIISIVNTHFAYAVEYEKLTVFWLCDISGSMKNEQAAYTQAVTVFTQLLEETKDKFDTASSRIIRMGASSEIKPLAIQNAAIGSEPTDVVGGFEVATDEIIKFLDENESSKVAFIITSDLYHTKNITSQTLETEKREISTNAKTKMDTCADLLSPYLSGDRLRIYYIKYTHKDPSSHVLLELPKTLVDATVVEEDTDLTKAFTLAYARLASGLPELNWISLSSTSQIENPLFSFLYLRENASSNLPQITITDGGQKKTVSAIKAYEDKIFKFTSEAKGISPQLSIDNSGAEILVVPAPSYVSRVVAQNGNKNFYIDTPLRVEFEIQYADLPTRFNQDNSLWGNRFVFPFEYANNPAFDNANRETLVSSGMGRFATSISPIKNRGTYYWHIDTGDNILQSGKFDIENRSPEPKRYVGLFLQDAITVSEKDANASIITFDLSRYFSDPDDDTLTFSLKNATEGISLDGTTLSISRIKDSGRDFALIINDDWGDPFEKNYVVDFVLEAPNTFLIVVGVTLAVLSLCIVTYLIIRNTRTRGRSK